MKNWKELLGKLEPEEREPLEVRNAVLDAIEGLAQALGDGRRGLVFNRIVVRLLSPSVDRRTLLAAVLDGEPGLREAAVSRLERKGCVAPRDLVIEIATDAPPAGSASGDFSLAPSRTASEPPPPAPRPARPKARLILMSGGEVEIASDVFNIGRVQEVRGSDHRPVRRNHVFFGEDATSVSRQHAQIRWDPESGEFRIFDNRSARGTRLFSNGEPIDVPPGRSRGEALHSGDEIYFGSVGARFEVG